MFRRIPRQNDSAQKFEYQNAQRGQLQFLVALSAQIASNLCKFYRRLILRDSSHDGASRISLTNLKHLLSSPYSVLRLRAAFDRHELNAIFSARGIRLFHKDFHRNPRQTQHANAWNQSSFPVPEALTRYFCKTIVS
jgi:hypothetical protein